MTTLYIPFAANGPLALRVAAINLAYNLNMRAALGRAPGQTIDSFIDSNGVITGPASTTITTRLVQALTFPPLVGGLIVVDDAVAANAAPALLVGAVARAALILQWQNALDTLEAPPP